MHLEILLAAAVVAKILFDLAIKSILPALRDRTPVRFKVDGRNVEVDVDRLSRPELERRIVEALKQ